MLRVLFTLSVFLTITVSALGQADVSSATVKGAVTDPQGAAISNATVTVRSLDQGVARTATTGAGGEFQILTVRPGLHEITVRAEGFAQYLIKDVRLTVGQTAVYDIKLEVAKVTNEVTVTSSAPLIEVERTQQANTIERKQIESLPNIGRDFTSYVFTLPGVSSSAAPRVQSGARFNFGSSGFSIGGSNGRNNLVTVDGGENEYGSGQLRFDISPEAVQEFQVNRNGSTAENGFTAGTAINVVTKSGTNDFHGSGYAFYRSQKTSGHNPVNFRPGEEKPFNQQIYSGFTLGGPVVKNKLFFFTNYEKTKSDIAQVRRYTNSPFLQPSTAQSALLSRLGNSTNATISGLAANLRAALTTTADRYPNTVMLLTENEGSFVNRDRLNNWITRVDYQPTERDSISGRFTYQRNFNGQLGGVNLVAPNRTNTLTVRDYTTLLTWTRNVSANVVNTARVQVSPRNKAFTEPVTPDSASLIIDSGAFGSFGRDFTAPFNTLQDRLQLEDNLAWINGNHTTKFGGSYRPVRYAVRNELWFSGDWTFSSGTFPITTIVPSALVPAFNAQVCATAGVSAADCTAARLTQLLAGTQLTGLQGFNFGLPVTVRQGFNNPLWKGNGQYLAFFAQDTWKVNQRLTVDYGGRVDYDGEPEPLPKNTYFSPRLGFAWDVAGDHKTVVRGGGGIYYSPVNYQVVYVTNLLNDSGLYINQVLPTASDPGTRSSIALWAYGVSIGKLPFKALGETDFNARGVSTGRGAPNRVLFQADPDYKNNYSIQANLGVQRQIMPDLSLDVAYQMYRGVHLQRSHQVNYRESAIPNTRGPAFGPAYARIDPSVAQLNNYESTANSIYHGMTVSLTKRLSNYFQFQANYTFSKAIDDVTDYNSAFAAAFPTRLHLERSLSSFDIRHNFVANAVLLSPFKNWALRDITISPVVYIRTGIPFTLYTGADTNGDTHTNDRLIYIGRNTGVGPNFRSVDLRFNKTFRLKSDGAARIEFLVEGINLLNRTNFAAVNDVIGTDLNSPDYKAGTVRLQGRRDRGITQPLAFIAAFDPRRVQFGLRLAF
ncbi:MAG TPA: carboxypeptidase regulatory-like domain-containing protein [Blastocatellia bacterium]|nr:carboxypeptidase regulatory-like domain-containing protein [Blastocatellia bacterium]